MIEKTSFHPREFIDKIKHPPTIQVSRNLENKEASLMSMAIGFMVLALGSFLGVGVVIFGPEVVRTDVIIALIAIGLLCLAIHVMEELAHIRKVQSYFIREKIEQRQRKLSQSDLLSKETSINIREIEQLEGLL